MRVGSRGAAGAFLVLALGVRGISAQPSPVGDSLATRGTASPLAATRIVHTTLHDAIGPASAHFLIGAIERAEKARAAGFVLELDTPGGLDEAMRDVVKRILAADVPVVVYVAPSGSRAASAGFFILMSAHVAAMAPGTNTGAAHPVQLGGAKPDSTLSRKLENDAASFVRSLAQKRGRNVVWSERAVRESASLSAEEALEQHVIDLVAPDLRVLLERLDGRRVELASGPRTIRTQGARLEELTMGWRDRLLSTISNPNIAYLLLMLGSLGIVVELWNPGAVLPGTVGAISLLLAFFALQVLPVNDAGLLLLLLGIGLLILEVKVTSHGALAAGGIIALLFGSLLLFQSPGSVLRVSLAVIVPTVLGTALLLLFVVSAGLRAQRRRPVTGPQGMIGEIGRADSAIAPEGRVFVHGEYWNARAAEPIEPGAQVEILAVEGHHLVVQRH